MSSNDVDVDALLEESLNKEMSNRKRTEPEDSNLDLRTSDEKRRRSSSRDYDRDYGTTSRDRDYRDRDRDYRDRDRDYRDRDRDRDYYGGSSRDRDRYDRDYSSSSRSSRDYRDRDRDYRDRDYYSSSSSSRDRDRDYSSRDSYKESSSRDSRERSRYSESSSRDRHSDVSSNGSGSNRESKEKSTAATTTPASPTSSTSSQSTSGAVVAASTTPHKERSIDSSSGLPEPDEESDQRTVFVSKLSQNVVEQDLFDLFASAGTVSTVRLITDKVTKRMKGVGYVEFTEKSSVNKAIALSGSILDGQSILVHSIQPEKKVSKLTGSGESRIYVGYIHLSVQEEQIRTIFAPYGDIDFINIHTKPGISKYAFIQFKTQESARKAIAELNGYELMGKNLKLNMVSQEKNSNGTYVQVPQINNIVHHGYIPNPMYSGTAAIAQLQHQGYPINPYIQQQQQQMLMMQQQQHHHLHPQLAQQQIQAQIQAQVQAHLQGNNPQNNSNQHTFKENNALSSLDEDDGGIPLTAQGRALLTAKLQGKTITPSPPPPSTIPINNNNNSILPTGIIIPYTSTPQFPFISCCVLLRNMFDPETETEENWDQEVLAETHAECSTFGKILNIYLDKNTKGCIYIRYDNPESPLKAIQKLHGRWFSKKQIVAELVPETSMAFFEAQHKNKGGATTF